MGVDPQTQPSQVCASRAPTTGDNQFVLGTRWLDTSSNTLYDYVAANTWQKGGNADATTTVAGIVKINTDGTLAGADNTTVPTALATKTYADALAIAGAPDASTSVKGIAELATTAEATTGTDTSRIMTPANVASVMAAPPAIGSGTPGAGSFTTLAATGAIDFDAGGSFESGGATIDIGADASADAINVGTGAAARTITIGNVTGATALAFNAGTGGIALASTGAGDITLNSDDTLLLDADGVLELNSSAGVIGIGNDADAQNINIGTGAAARTITMGNSTGATSLVLDCGSGALNVGTNAIAHTVTIGNVTGATAVAINVGTGNYAVDGVGASTYNIGASTTSGTVTIGGTSQTGNFVLAPSDGIMTVNIANGNGKKTINFGDGVDGNDIDIGNGINTSAQTIDIANAASAANSTVNILSGNGSAGTQTLNALGGTRAGALNLATGAAAHVIAIGSASAGAVTVDTAAGISLDSATASNFTVTGAADLTVSTSAGSLILSAGESANDAIKVEATAGGIDILASGAAAGEDIDIVATGSSVNISATEADPAAITLNASAGGLTVDSAGILELNSSAGVIGIGNDAVAQNINIGTGAAARTVTVGNTTGASGLVLQAGTGEITVTGTVKEIDAEFLFSSGTDLTVTQSPIMQSNANTGAVPAGTDTGINLMHLQDGCLMEQYMIGTQTIIAPRMTANGLNLALDQTAGEGSEYNFGARNNAKHAYTIGTSAAFFIEATVYLEDISGCAPLMIGFRKVEANNSTFADYTDYVGIGINQATSATNVSILDELNSGGQTATDTTDAWGGDAAAQTVKVLVSAAGVVTFEVGGSAASAAPAFTFDNGDVVMPYIHIIQGADLSGEIGLQNLKIGFQA